MKPSNYHLLLLLSSLLFTKAEAVLVYWIDVDANTLTISGTTSGVVTNGGLEWLFENGDDGDSHSQLSLIGGSFSLIDDILAFSAGGVTDAFFVGSELSNGPETLVASNAVYDYGSLPSSVETFIEESMLGNDIPLISGDGFGDIVYLSGPIPEPGTTMLLGVALLGVLRRRR